MTAAKRKQNTGRWARSVTDGWIDLGKLRVPDVDRPECGARDCELLAKHVDPIGVGWCEIHRRLSFHRAGRP